MPVLLGLGATSIRFGIVRLTSVLDVHDASGVAELPLGRAHKLNYCTNGLSSLAANSKSHPTFKYTHYHLQSLIH